MVTDSQRYFERRAEQEREAAEHADDERAARPHREMAALYAERAAQCFNSEYDEPAANGLPADFRILP